MNMIVMTSLLSHADRWNKILCYLNLLIVMMQTNQSLRLIRNKLKGLKWWNLGPISPKVLIYILYKC